MLLAETLQQTTWVCLHFVSPGKEPVARAGLDESGFIRGSVLFFREARRFWQRASHIAGKLVESWLFTAEEWSRYGIPFHLVFIW